MCNLLGMCSSLCLGSMATVGLLTDPVTLPLFRSALDADWVMVRMLFPRRTGDWKLVTLPFRRGDGVWMEASWLVMSLSCWSSFLSVAASGACSLAKSRFSVTVSSSTRQETMEHTLETWEIKEYLQPSGRLSSCPQSAPIRIKGIFHLRKCFDC